MPSRKILVVLIVCLGLVGAVWILERSSGESATSAQTASQNALVAEDASSTDNAGNGPGIDWQNILSNTQSSTTIASGLQNTGGTAASDGTLTAQLAKDFFGRYLLAQGQANQNGEDTTNGIDTNTSDQIASDVLSSGSYTTTQAVVYVVKNLNIQPTSDQATVTNYLKALLGYSNQMAASAKQNGSEVDIINDAISNQDQSEIAKLDPIIASYQTLLSSMLKVPVPENAISLQLEFVNNISRVLYDLQAIRQAFLDPVKALAAISVYKQDYTNMGLDIQKLQTYAQTEVKD